jgi:hypothetical protein
VAAGVLAMPRTDGRYEVLGRVPEDEILEFEPGTIVCGALKMLSEDEAFVAVAASDRANALGAAWLREVGKRFNLPR